MASTIRDVAKHAGVSTATVSRTLRDPEIVSPSTRERVQRAVQELAFEPSHLGRQLAERRHAANGIVFPDLSGPYYAEVVLGYEEVAAEAGRSVLILSTHGRRDVAAMVRELAGRVDGMVIFGRTVDDTVVSDILATHVPVVLIARPPVGTADTVNTENRAGATHLTEHLLAHGLRRLAFLGDPATSTDAAERWQSFATTLRHHDLDPGHPIRCDFGEQAGHDAARHLLSNMDRPEALVCADDEIALGALAAAEEVGIRVPDQLAITGWDDIMSARHVRPALTTVRQPMRELGAHAARALDELITGARTDPRRELLPTELVIRRSCGMH
jgi:LacI family transcriptional regulator, galactose operon repressor